VTATTWTPLETHPKLYAELSGDDNPVHLDPKVAQAAGFPTNIVHGMNTLGAVARAAGNDAPGLVLRKADIRFAAPSFPGQTLTIEGTPKELPDGTVKVGMKIHAPDEPRSLMSPANFTFGPAELSDELQAKLLKNTDVQERDDDVIAEDYTFSDADVARYRELTNCDIVPPGDALPMFMGTLGLTDALWFAFSEQKPDEPGNFVHLRQAGTFVAPIETGVAYRCRVQAGLMKVRKSPMGAMFTIPLLVQESATSKLVQTGVVTLIFVPDKSAKQ